MSILQTYISEHMPKVFGVVLILLLLGVLSGQVGIIKLSAWIGLVAGASWSLNIIFDESFDTNHKIRLNLLPLLCFISSTIYLFGHLQ